MRETFLPVLLARERAHSTQAAEHRHARQVFLTACTRPLRFIFQTRLIPVFTLYTSILTSYLAILLTTLGTTFESLYGFSPGSSGLAYMGMTVGYAVSEISLGYFSDAYAARKAQRRLDGIRLPEDHLSPLIVGALLFPGSLLMYGWTLEEHTMWLAPTVASGMIAFATMYSYIPVQIYIVQVYTLHTASAMGAMAIIRSFITACVPLGAAPMYARLGYGWSYTLLAGLALPFIGFGIVLVRWGERIRSLDSTVH